MNNPASSNSLPVTTPSAPTNSSNEGPHHPQQQPPAEPQMEPLPSTSAACATSGSPEAQDKPESPGSKRPRKYEDPTLETRKKIAEVAALLKQNAMQYLKISQAIKNMRLAVEVFTAESPALWGTPPEVSRNALQQGLDQSSRILSELRGLRDWMLQTEYALHTTFMTLMETSRQQQELRRQTRSQSRSGSLPTQQHLPPELTDDRLMDTVNEIVKVMILAQLF